MKKLALIALALSFCAASAHATTVTPGTPAATPQQNRMKSCATEYHAKNIPKAQYKTFMSGCLKTHSAAAKKAAPATPATSAQ